MPSITNTPVTFTYTGKLGYTSTVTYTYIPNGYSNISLSIDETAPSKNTGPTITISPAVLNNGITNTVYTAVTFTATGGVAPYAFSLTSGALPTGLSLDSNILEGTVSSSAQVGIYPVTITATDANGNTGSKSYNITITAASVNPSTPTTPPVFPAPTADTKSFKYIKGESYMSLPTADKTYVQTIGAELINTLSQPIILNVVDANGNNIPKGTTIKLYDSSGNVLQSFYTGDKGTAGTTSSVNLYYTPTASTVIFTASVSMDNQGTGWVPVTTLSATGTGRIVQGSNHANVFGPNVGNYGTGLFAGGNANDTYLRYSDLLDLFGTPLNTTNNFISRLNGQSFQNPYYGALIPAGDSEIGFAQIDPATINTPYGSNIVDTIIDFGVITDPLIQSSTPLKLYTPYTFLKTNQPFWIQTVLPYTSYTNGFSAYGIDWGDGTPIDKVDASVNPNSVIYFTHSYTTARNTPYTVTVRGYWQSSDINRVPPVQPLATSVLSARFYVQDTFPEISLADYSKTLEGTTPVLPYKQSDVEIGSNEWVTADNINAVLTKLDTNFNYLNSITKTIRKAPQFELVEWVGDLLKYPTWNTQLSGSNSYTNLSSTHLGFMPGVIRDFKSYKSPYSAPDYYNYIVYNSDNAYSFLEVRRNNFTNDRVAVLSAVIPGADNINIYTADASGSNMYILASDTYPYGITSLYRFGLNYNAGTATATVINQIGGAKPDGTAGTLLDQYYFGTGNTYTDVPTTLKLYNNQVYVADKSNNCIKVYNTALTYVNTIYTSALTGYEVDPFDIDLSTGNIFMLGTLKAPNKPVIVSVQTSAVDPSTTQYAVTWDHDGLRLASVRNNTPNFTIWGEVEGNGGNFFAIDTFYSPAVNASSAPRLTKYVFDSTQNYVNFAIQAMSKYGAGYDSDLSSPLVTPNQDVFPSPYKVFVFDQSNNLLNTLQVPEIPANANIIKLLIEPTGVFFYIVTDSYIYKYTTTGLFVNRINSPSIESGALNEPIVTAFIDDRNYFYIATATRIFKFIDLPGTATLFDIDRVSNYYTLLSSYTIGSDELIQDWVYNKSINAVLKNHEILAKSIAGKYVITVDQDNNLVSFENRQLSANDVINNLNVNESNFVHVNEIVSSAVINRVVDKIYNIQTVILSAVTPEYVVQPPSYTSYVLGRTTAASAYTYYQYNQPKPIIVSQPASIKLLQGQNATFTFNVSSAGGADTINYQWFYDNVSIDTATTSAYTVTDTQLTNVGYYYCSAYDAAGSVTSDNALLDVGLEALFAFKAVDYFGNLFSPNYSDVNGRAIRYPNDFTATTRILNALSSSNIIIVLTDRDNIIDSNAVPVTSKFALDVTMQVKQNGTLTYTAVVPANTTLPLQIEVPFDIKLAEDSNNLQSDGFPGTYGTQLEITLSVGDVAQDVSTQVKPKLAVTVDQGYLYDATFQANMVQGIGTFPDLTIWQLSGNTVPYAGIGNNTLGGYLINIPTYAEHTWSVDDPFGVNGTLNPKLNFTPSSTESVQLNWSRNVPGETEAIMAFTRAPVSAPATPFYTITNQSGSIAGGGGYMLGSGSYPAGTIQKITAVGTYELTNIDRGQVGPPGSCSNAPLIITSKGSINAGTYQGYGGIIRLAQDSKADTTSYWYNFVDNNINNYTYFHH